MWLGQQTRKRPFWVMVQLPVVNLSSCIHCISLSNNMSLSLTVTDVYSFGLLSYCPFNFKKFILFLLVVTKFIKGVTALKLIKMNIVRPAYVSHAHYYSCILQKRYSSNFIYEIIFNRLFGLQLLDILTVLRLITLRQCREILAYC